MTFGIRQAVRSAEDRMEKAGVLEYIVLMMVLSSYGMTSIVKLLQQQLSLQQPPLQGVTMKENGTQLASLKELMHVGVDTEHSVVWMAKWQDGKNLIVGFNYQLQCRAWPNKYNRAF